VARSQENVGVDEFGFSSPGGTQIRLLAARISEVVGPKMNDGMNTQDGFRIVHLIGGPSNGEEYAIPEDVIVFEVLEGQPSPDQIQAMMRGTPVEWRHKNSHYEIVPSPFSGGKCVGLYTESAEEKLAKQIVEDGAAGSRDDL
jgi:hypothetical protein